jgi:hypothetical protein
LNFAPKQAFPPKQNCFRPAKMGLLRSPMVAAVGERRAAEKPMLVGAAVDRKVYELKKINSQFLRTFIICVKFDWKELKYNPLAEIFMKKEIKQLICHLPDP